MKASRAIALNYVGCPFEIKELSDTGTFEGLASVYGNIDLGDDIVEPGAFKEIVKTRDGQVRILNAHNPRDPIGKGFVTDTHIGLAIKGALLLSIASARNTYELMKAGVIDGLSIGFDTLPGGSEIDEKGIRHLKALKLWEISTTVFPMNQQAQVSSVKALEKVTTVRELEELLRDAVGLSRAQAKQHACAVWKTLTGQRDADSGAEEQAKEFLGFLKTIKEK